MRNGQREHFCNGEYCQCRTYWSSERDYNSDDELVSGWRCNNCGRWEPKRVQRRSYKNRTPNKSQQAAIEKLRRVIERDLDVPRGEMITKFDLEETGYDYGFWLSVKKEMTALPAGNLLRALSIEYWHVYVGPRGRLDAHTYPESLKQFKGGQFLGINIK